MKDQVNIMNYMEVIMNWFYFLIVMLFTNVGYAYTGFGICNYGKEVIPEVICYGPTVLKETTVNGNVKVTGPLKAYNVSMSSLDVTGTVEIENSNVVGEAHVTGLLSSTKTKFEKGLAVTGDHVELNHSTINGTLTISSSSEKPLLDMSCDSWVTGSVIFSGSKGVVKITDDSMVKGKLENAEFEFVKKICK